MLLAITYQLRDALKARGVPLPVIAGPEVTKAGVSARSRIVVERERGKGESVSAPRTIQRNPTLQYVRTIAFRVRIWARSTIAGATAMDHERLADIVADQVLLVLRGIASSRRTVLRIGGCGMVSAGELDATTGQAWAGVVYELACEIDRGVLDADYHDVIAAEAAAGGDAGFGFGLETDIDGVGGSELPSADTRI
jgi:hypothetical protein